MDARRAVIVIAYALVACAVGALCAALSALVGVRFYELIIPRHGGCGDIGCWDSLIGGFWGAGIGFLGGTWLGWRLPRARRQAALAVSAAETPRS